MSAEAGGERTAARWTLAAFAAVSVLFSGAFPPFANPNELSRYEAVVAAADHRTFAIDAVIPVLGDHEDKSLSGGRTYSNKAPGLALAATPVYGLLRLAAAPPRSAAEPLFWILRVLTVTLVCVAALARLARRLSRVDPAAAPLVLAGVAFGTPFLFFARSFFAHAWTGALLFLSWDAIRSGEDAASRRRGLLLSAAARFLAGWAAISEYAVAPVALLLALRALRVGGRGRAGALPAFAAFAAGAAAPLATLAVYDAICFGSPWVLSSAREAYPSYSRLAGEGLFGFGAPSLRVAAAYLFHPARGLLIFSPFLIWAIPGFLRWWRSREDRADCAFALGATLLYFVLMTGYPNWHGGWSLGDRYLVPILFFPALALPRALATPRSRGLFGAAVVLSAGTHLLLTASWPYFPEDVAWPAATGSAWFLARGWVAPSVLAGAPAGGWIALALAAAAVAVSLALALRRAEPGSLRPLSAVAGLLPLALLLASPPTLGFGGRLWRAAIYGAYSGRDPGRVELRRVAESAATPQEQRMAVGAWRAYGPR
jgi:hypothetical protein